MSDWRIKTIRSTLATLNFEPVGCLSIIREAYQADKKMWDRLGDQREAWQDWTSAQKPWSSRKCPVDPTCRPTYVRYYVQSINGLWEAISALGSEFRRFDDIQALDAALTCYWTLFKKYQALETYLILGDDDIRAYRRKVAQ